MKITIGQLRQVIRSTLREAGRGRGWDPHGVPVPYTGKRKSYKPDSARQWQGMSYRTTRRVSDMRDDMVTADDGHVTLDGSREDDYDILRHDQTAWKALLNMFRGAGDHPEDYTWTITDDGYQGDHDEHASLHWHGGPEWMIG